MTLCPECNDSQYVSRWSGRGDERSPENQVDVTCMHCPNCETCGKLASDGAMPGDVEGFAYCSPDCAASDSTIQCGGRGAAMENLSMDLSEERRNHATDPESRIFTTRTIQRLCALELEAQGEKS